jgi:bifunctional non-homologous end joining protein LigD
MGERSYGAYRVEISNSDKVFFPDTGMTKGDLIDYYERVAETMLPHLEGRPLTLHRYPDGLAGEGFYQKQIPEYFPKWVSRVEVSKKEEGGSQLQVICDRKATLVYLANQACVTPHIWLSREDKLDHPDRMIIDLDPPGDDFEPVRRAARQLRDWLEELELVPFLMLTGSRGAHVVAPLRRDSDFDTVRAFAQAVAEELARRHPDDLTTAQRKDKRGERLFLDTARNAYGQTAVAPYSVRALPGAPVATPLDWSELDDSRLTARRYSIENLFRRLAQKRDPWHEISRHSRSPAGAAERLKRLKTID